MMNRYFWPLLIGLMFGFIGAHFMPQARAQELDVPALIVDAAERHNLPAYRLLCMARRESGFDPAAVSPWGHAGLWQWTAGTWQWASERAGYAGFSPFDPRASTEVAAWLMAQPYGWGHWSTAGGCW